MERADCRSTRRDAISTGLRGPARSYIDSDGRFNTAIASLSWSYRPKLVLLLPIVKKGALSCSCMHLYRWDSESLKLGSTNGHVRCDERGPKIAGKVAASRCSPKLRQEIIRTSSGWSYLENCNASPRVGSGQSGLTPKCVLHMRPA